MQIGSTASAKNEWHELQTAQSFERGSEWDRIDECDITIPIGIFVIINAC